MNKTDPLFSIVIPTRNRPEFLRECIQSILWQNFDDFEIVVSDNSTDTRTKEVVESFSNSRIIYSNTGKDLNMSESWEAASLKAEGRYVMILTDKWLMRNGSLEKMAKVIRSRPDCELLTTHCVNMVFTPINPGRPEGIVAGVFNHSNSVIVTPSKDILRHYAKDGRLDSEYPIFPPMCYGRGIAERVRKINGTLFSQVTPDKTSLFMLLLNTENMFGINEALVVTRTSKDSNAEHHRRVESESLTSSLNGAFPRFCPIKASFPDNIDFDDFLAMRKVMNPKDVFDDVDWADYFIRCWYNITYWEHAGFSRNRKDYFYKAWEAGLSTFSKEIQESVRSRMSKTRARAYTKSFLANNRFTPLLKGIQHTIRNRTPQRRYVSALEAAGFVANQK